MHYLLSIDQYGARELEEELRYFFGRIHHLKRRLKQEASSLHLNRIQRRRCYENILDLEALERDFYTLSHKEDIRHLYRNVCRYVKLDQDRLLNEFGYNDIRCPSLFSAL